MPEKKIEVGDIRPIYNIAGFEVCKITSDKPEEIEWTPVEKINEAEVLSFIYRQEKPTESKTNNKVNKKKNGRTKKEIEKELKETEKKIKELKESVEEEEIDDQDL